MKTINFNGTEYKLHVVNNENYELYENTLETLNICDPIYVSNDYENLSYSMLIDEPDEGEEASSYLGFFISDKSSSKIYSSLIIDINCNQIREKLETINHNPEQHEIYDTSISSIELDKSIEIVLLCSNSKERISGLTSFFLNYIIRTVIPRLKPGTKNILLSVAQGIDKNNRAGEFYGRFGFIPLTDSIMKFSYYGGKRRDKSRKHKSKSKLSRSTRRKKNRIHKSRRYRK